MKLFPTHDLSHYNTQWREGQTTTLTNGQTLLHPWWTTGGGNEYRHLFLEKIKELKPHTHAYEWCSGHGVIGFECLTQGLCQTLAFSDYYELATQSCHDNALTLGLDDKVRVYTTPTLKDIPSEEQWDLVLGNPPNGTNEEYQRAHYEREGQAPDLIDLSLRLTVDVGLQIHQDFFQELQAHLLPGADVLLTVSNHLLEPIQALAKTHTLLEWRSYSLIGGNLGLAHWSLGD